MNRSIAIEEVGKGEKTAKKPVVFAGSARENFFYIALFLVAALGGAIRKWLTTSGGVSNGVLLVQMTLPFLMVLFRSAKSVSPFKKFPILYFYFFYLTIQIFQPLQVTPYHGMLGMVIHGGFWLGMFFYLSNRSLFRPAKFVHLLLIISAIEIVLGFIQYSLPSDNILNKYSSQDMAKSIAMVGDRVRITGTFSYLSGFTAFLLFYNLFIWVLLRLKFNSWVVAIASVFGVVACFMTGSRSGTLLYIMFTTPMILKEFPPQELLRFAVRLILPAAIIFTVVLVVKKIPVTDQIGKAYENFFGRVQAARESGEEATRISSDLYYLENSDFKYPLMGIGTGATYQGAIILFGTSPYALEFGYVENEMIKILLEGGFILLVFKIVLTTMVVMNLSFKGWIFRLIIWVILANAAPIAFNVHNSAFLLLGIILIDNVIWRQQAEQGLESRDNGLSLL